MDLAILPWEILPVELLHLIKLTEVWLPSKSPGPSRLNFVISILLKKRRAFQVFNDRLVEIWKKMNVRDSDSSYTTLKDARGQSILYFSISTTGLASSNLDSWETEGESMREEEIYFAWREFLWGLELTFKIVRRTLSFLIGWIISRFKKATLSAKPWIYECRSIFDSSSISHTWHRFEIPQLPVEIPFRLTFCDSLGGGKTGHRGMHLGRPENVSRGITCSLTNATVPMTTFFTAACQHGGHDEREAVEKVSKVRDIERYRRLHRKSVRLWFWPFGRTRDRSLRGRHNLKKDKSPTCGMSPRGLACPLLRRLVFSQITVS